MNIAKIFGKEEQGESLVADMKEKVEVISKEVKGKSKEVVKVFVYDSGEDTAFTVGGNSLENELICLAGGENIFSQLEKGFTSVGWEDIIQSNPDVIIVHKWSQTDDADKKIEYLKSKKELSEVPAVKNNRFIVVSLLSVFPSIQNVDALETIAQGLK